MQETYLQVLKKYLDKFEPPDELADLGWKHHPSLVGVNEFLKIYIQKCGEMKGYYQYEFHWKEPDYPPVHGFVDLLLPDKTIAYEFKYSSNPDSYSAWVLRDQLAIYFLGVPTLERITARIIRVPALRPGKKETETQFSERLSGDMQRRWGYYMQDHSYWRQEFDLDKLRARLRAVGQEMQRYMAAENPMDAHYQNSQACFSPFACDYLGICENGDLVSEQLYQRRQTKRGGDDSGTTD